MTINTQTRKAGPYIGNGSATVFPFAFKVFSAADVYVVRTDTALGVDTTLAQGSDYTVSLNANQNSNPGGTITVPTALATGFNLTIASTLAYLQPTDLTNQGGFYPSVITNALDRLTILCQQLLESVTRSLKISVSTPAGVDTTLPPPASNKLIGWNPSATALQNMDPTTLATIVAFGTAVPDVFVGNGVQTQFALTANPGALGNLDVAVGGVTQTPGINYFWTTGTTITFAVAPPLGARILVRYFQALPQGVTDSAASTFTPLGTGAASSNVQTKLREWPSVRDFGALGDGVADDTARIQAAIDAVSTLPAGQRILRINSAPAGYYRITSALTISSNFVTLLFDTTSAILRKEFNGEVLRILGGEVEIHRCGIDGQGGTYTGGGIRLVTTSANSFKLFTPRITQTADAPVMIEANAGSLMKIIGGLLQPFNAAAAGPTHAVRMTAADTAPANRLFLGISSGGAPLVDCTGAETMLLIGCDGSRFTTSSTSKKVLVNGCRLQTAGANIQVSGVDHCVTGNVVASSIELTATASNCTVRGNTTVGVEVLDASGGLNNSVRVESASFTPTWTASTTNPTLGNGTLTGRFSKDGKMIDAATELVIGSTTTGGTGTYSFALPFQAAAGVAYTGSVWLFRNGVTFRTGTVLITGGANTAAIYFDQVAGQFGAGTPYTLANGDIVRFSVRYLGA